MGKRKRLLRLAGRTSQENGYPYHTKTGEKRNVYHILPKCPDGEGILDKDIRPGGYGRSLCKECRRLIVEGRG